MNLWQSIPLFGSCVNFAAIVAGSVVGVLLKSRIKEDVMKLPMQCLGIISAVIGIGMALKSQNILIVVASLCLGSIIGGFMDIDGRIERQVRRLQDRFKNLGSDFAEGFLSATLIYCIGSMAVLGSFEEGMGSYPSLLVTKAMMDGLMSVALSASLGIGVAFSAVPTFLYQGLLTLATGLIMPYMTPAATAEMTAAGVSGAFPAASSRAAS